MSWKRLMPALAILPLVAGMNLCVKNADWYPGWDWRGCVASIIGFLLITLALEMVKAWIKD